VAPGASDLDALNAAGVTVTENNSGLVCAINNYPANGLQTCLATSGGLYYYWSYWQGDPYANTWTYAEVGPAEHTVNEGQTYVEGWRYQDPGPSGPSATKPSMTPAAAFAQACPGVTPVPTSRGGAGSSGSGSGGATTTQGTAPATSPTSQGSSVAAGPSPPAAGVSGSRSVTSTTTTRSESGSGSIPPGDGTGSVSTTTTTSATRANGSAGKQSIPRSALANTMAHKGDSGGAAALPIVLVALLIVAFGAAAWFRWRRRAAEE